MKYIFIASCIFFAGCMPQSEKPVAFESGPEKVKNFDLKTYLTAISKHWHYELTETAPGVFKMNVALLQKDDSWKYQDVFIWIIKGRHFGKDVVYMNSRCGLYTKDFDAYKLLKEGGYGTFCTVTITTDELEDGTPCETVITQAVQPVQFTNDLILNEVIYDVAFNAEIIKTTYFL